MSYSVGSLVKVRGREWVVLSQNSENILKVKPLGGTDVEITSIHLQMEKVEPASFDLPDPQRLGDARSARLLRNAARLGFRDSAGPFRSLGSIAVEPRPYQLVPLLMALRQNPVRLLIADDVGIGKTVESALVAKELLARGEADQLCVLCPPHLAEQWQVELSTKFNLDAVLVLPSTVNRLERECSAGESVFEHFPVTIVSLDYIKQERRRDDFLRGCPDLVIVDEAHTCTQSGQSSQLRFQLLKDLSAKSTRHMILVTATPHSGNEQAFRSMLSLLRPEFAHLPEELGGDHNRAHREKLATHFVQRRRADIAKHFIEDTPFPTRKDSEVQYKLHPEFRELLDKAVDYAREVIADNSGTKFQQRIRWWSALAMLRSISSSPAAAAATLRARANNAGSEELPEIEELGRKSVMDVSEAEAVEGFDVSPGADTEIGDTPTRRKLRQLANLADKLQGDKDNKLQILAKLIKELLKDGSSPIIFCKYIATAEYLAEGLRKSLGKKVEVGCVTGQLPHDEREERVVALAEHDQRVLVCTDCLSEGINLQEYFDTVVHADLAWSPTRHEQREGRVDRFNQKSKIVKVVTLYGENNPVDGIVFQILLRKHKIIRSSLGISVPVPVNTEKVLEAIFEALLLKGENDFQPSLFSGTELDEQKELNVEWDKAAAREKRNRAIFAQNAIKIEEVAQELADIRQALGTPLDIQQFVTDSVKLAGGKIGDKEVFELDLTSAPTALQDATDIHKPVKATFKLPAARGAVYLSRTSRLVESLASFVLDSALAGDEKAVASRCGVMATNAVTQMTTLLVLRFRFQIITSKHEMLAEDAATIGFKGLPANPTWLKSEEAALLLDAAPTGNILPDMAKHLLSQVIASIGEIKAPLRELAKIRSEKVLASHRRVRKAIEGSVAAREVKVQGEPDILGLYILMPFGGAS